MTTQNPRIAGISLVHRMRSEILKGIMTTENKT